MQIELKHISIVGLGKLGLPLAACFAWKGFRTIGVDYDSMKVRAVNQGNLPSYEPGLQEILDASRQRLVATGDYRKAVMESDVTFILVPTPSNKDNSFSLQYVLRVAKHIGEAIRKKSAYHLIVLVSTVMPGSIEKKLKPLLETTSKERCGKDFGLCYNPEFVALGNVIHDLLNPDFILIGESDPFSGKLLANLYRHFCENKPRVARMNFINAELTKLAVNTLVTTKISFANTLARICEQLPGADVDVVTSALGLDSRIGPKYLKGAVAYGGPCFPRDNLALARLAHSVGALATLPEATDNFNRRQVRWLAELVKNHLPRNGSIGILGLSYKPNSDVVEEAQGLLLAQLLVSTGVKVIVYDPIAMENAKQVLNESVTFAVSAKSCIEKSDVVVLTIPWDEFKQLSSKELTRSESVRVVIDCWRVLSKLRNEKGIIYIPLGIGSLK